MEAEAQEELDRISSFNNGLESAASPNHLHSNSHFAQNNSSNGLKNE
jgi:hypothetical protein